MQCLENMILRLDFLSPIDINDKLDAEVVREITKYYKKAEPKQLKRNVLYLSKQPIDDSKISQQLLNDEVQWVFNSQSGEKFTIGTNEMILTSSLGYEKSVKDKASKVIEIIFNKYAPQLRRIGLRYINRFPNEGKDTYINEKLLYYKDLYDGFDIDNTISTLEIKKEINNLDAFFRINHGVVKNEELNETEKYLLDIDGFTRDTTYEFSEVIACVEEIHQIIKKLFKDSLTDQYRGEFK